MRSRMRREKPHGSFYASPAVFRTLRQLAAAEDVKQHDVLVEGLQLMSERYGFDYDELDRETDLFF